MQVKIIKGKRFLFWGKNKYGQWLGVNIISGRFGIYVDW